MKRLLHATLIACLPLGLWAQEKCELSSESPIEAYHFYPAGDENCYFLTQLDSSLRKAAEIAGQDVDILLMIGREGSGASYDVGRTLNIFQRFVVSGHFDQPYYHTLIENLSVIVHEYGHALFSEALAGRFIEYASFLEEMKNFSTEEMRLLKLGASTQEVSELALRRRAIFLKKENMALFKKALPYQELYADVMAAFEASNMTAISQALYRPGMSEQEENLIEARSFRPDPHFTIHRYNTTEEHVFFWRVRRFIGEKLWPENFAQKQSYLRLITKALLDDMSEMTDETLAHAPDERNEALIERLEASISSELD